MEAARHWYTLFPPLWRRFSLALSLEGGIDYEIEDDDENDYYCYNYYEEEPPWCFCHEPEQGEREPEQRREGIRHDRSGAVIRRAVKKDFIASFDVVYICVEKFPPCDWGSLAPLFLLMLLLHRMDKIERCI